jgi:L-threonylcarbamoyladenylate synthase
MREPFPFHQAVQAGVKALAQGELIGMPTETVYGLAGDATNPSAVARIYQAKGRPTFNPLISHVSDLGDAQREGTFSSLARQLAAAFWPGPLTLVVPRHESTSVCDLACAGLSTIALRVPDHALTLDLLARFGRPVAAPSANVSGRPSPTTPDHVRSELGTRVAFVLEGGPCSVGIESAVVAVSGAQATLLRLGGLSRQDLEDVAGPLLAPSAHDKAAPPSPGMILRHYAPNAPVLLNQTAPLAGGVFIGFGQIGEHAHFNLSPDGDLTQAAANLFAYLRAADALAPQAIAIAPIPSHGLGEAINDRLMRAARG